MVPRRLSVAGYCRDRRKPSAVIDERGRPCRGSNRTSLTPALSAFPRSTIDRSNDGEPGGLSPIPDAGVRERICENRIAAIDDNHTTNLSK
ncbi:hypothetical protein [Halegenticoccus soli]|uniref:hypothetical protein n=1 Tax=Halegenticoccus soli TaxID=1985678 RepID=UPI000C6D97A9|nr:hypothetical protein [Halegenticoccus soli]